MRVWLYCLEVWQLYFGTLEKDLETSLDVLRYFGYLVVVIGTLNEDSETSFRIVMVWSCFGALGEDSEPRCIYIFFSFF